MLRERVAFLEQAEREGGSGGAAPLAAAAEDGSSFGGAPASGAELESAAYVADRPYACDMCSYRAQKAGTLKVHKLKHGEDKKYLCSVPGCDYRAKQHSTLASHIKTRHASRDNPNPELVCGWRGCTFVAARKGQLARHRASLHDPLRDNALACKVAGCAFITENHMDMVRHLRQHLGQNNRKVAPAD